MNYEIIMKKTAKAIAAVEEVMNEIQGLSPNSETVLKAQFTQKLVSEVLDSLNKAGKLVLSDSYSERAQGFESCYYAARLLNLIEKECKEIRIALPVAA